MIGARLRQSFAAAVAAVVACSAHPGGAEAPPLRTFARGSEVVAAGLQARDNPRTSEGRSAIVARSREARDSLRTSTRGSKVVAAGLQARVDSALRLYIFDCGTLKDRDGVAYGLTREQVPPRDLADSCALVVHPRGTLLWETGLHESVNSLPPSNEARPGRPRAGDRVDRTLRAQLEQTGHAPASITYVALSHAHWDHTGNLRDFGSSTWLVQRAERDTIFGAAPLPNQQDFVGIERMRTQILDGDHDVFGDGSVRLLSAPGHTAGHQVLFVRLPGTGAVILSGDLYHFAEELTVAAAPGGRNAAQVAESKAKIHALMEKTGAQLWIQHDRNHFAKLRKAPAFYE